MKLERPPAIEDGEYWIGRFLIKVEGNNISVSPRQAWAHRHQKTDLLALSYFGSEACNMGLISRKDSLKAERRIAKLINSKEWKPWPYKSK